MFPGTKWGTGVSNKLNLEWSRRNAEDNLEKKVNQSIVTELDEVDNDDKDLFLKTMGEENQ